MQVEGRGGQYVALLAKIYQEVYIFIFRRKAHHTVVKQSLSG